MDVRQFERFMAKVEITDGCWNWTAGKKPNGYGQFGLSKERRSTYPHRIAYEHFVGTIPDGTEIDHLCFNRLCVNPAHLQTVTHAENCLRGEGLAAVNTRKTHCPQGHAYAEHGVHQVDGSRRCRPCHAAKQRRYKQRLRARA
jgi:hypothetical protein